MSTSPAPASHPVSTGHDRFCPAGQQQGMFPPPNQCICAALRAARADAAGIDPHADFTAGFAMGLAVGRGESTKERDALRAQLDGEYARGRDDAALEVTRTLAELMKEPVKARDDSTWSHRLFTAAKHIPHDGQ